jgi:hypothetical protein
MACAVAVLMVRSLDGVQGGRRAVRAGRTVNCSAGRATVIRLADAPGLRHREADMTLGLGLVSVDCVSSAGRRRRGTSRMGDISTAIEVAEPVRRGEPKASDVVDAALQAIAARNGELGAFVHVDEAGARAAAQAVDDIVARGDDPGPFAGAPMGVKDLEDRAGMPTSDGSLLFVGRRPVAEDSIHVARLRRAGAVPVGKTATPGSAHSTSPGPRRSVSPATPGTPTTRPAAPAAAARRRWPPASSRRPRRATAAGPSASRRPSVGGSASKPASAASPPPARTGPRLRCSAS